VKVYERLERNGTTTKWDRCAKMGIEEEGNSGFKVGM
jgi:hypothetical protein